MNNIEQAEDFSNEQNYQNNPLKDYQELILRLKSIKENIISLKTKFLEKKI